MFEDLEKYLSNNRRSPQHRPSEDDDDDGTKTRIDRAIKDALKKEFGEDIEISDMGGHGLAVKMPGSAFLGKLTGQGTDKKQLKIMVDGFAKSLYLLGEALKVKPICMDAKRKLLKEGDMLNCPGGEQKKVLKVGYGFCNLSRTDDHDRDDGVWFQEQINNLNFTL